MAVQYRLALSILGGAASPFSAGRVFGVQLSLFFSAVFRDQHRCAKPKHCECAFTLLSFFLKLWPSFFRRVVLRGTSEKTNQTWPQHDSNKYVSVFSSLTKWKWCGQNRAHRRNFADSEFKLCKLIDPPYEWPIQPLRLASELQQDVSLNYNL